MPIIDEYNSSLDELLRQKRLALNWSLAEVEGKTGIKVKNLKALEDGDYHALPAPVYVQGYLKNLARLYGLEFARMLALYREEQSLQSLKVDASKLQPQALTANRVTITPKTLTTAVLSLALVSIAIYMTGQISRVTAAPEIVVTSPDENLQTTQTAIAVSGRTDPTATLTINNQAAPLDGRGHFNQTVYLNLGENDIVIKASNRFGNFSQTTRRVVAAESRTMGGGTESRPEILGEQTKNEPK